MSKTIFKSNTQENIWKCQGHVSKLMLIVPNFNQNAFPVISGFFQVCLLHYAEVSFTETDS